ncbi:MAG: hypothetical protein ACJAS1_001843 [Oleiphilaceae bacterium]|jgi:hypothetical protein
MNFLKKNIKDITVNGVIKNLGEYDANLMELRAHEGVSIIDEDGDTLHFSMLLIPKSLSDKIKLGKSTTLNIIRIKSKSKLIGSVYAVKTEDDIGYIDSELSLQATKTLIRANYKRYLGGNPGAILTAATFLFLLGWIGLGVYFNNATSGGVAAAMITLSFYLWPMIVPALANISERLLEPISDGYKDVRATASKY